MLKNIIPKAFWGFQHNSLKKFDGILPISDHEIIFVVGSRLAVFDHSENSKSKLAYLGPKKVSEILFITVSQDLSCLAASVRIHGSKATMLIHQLDADFLLRSPALLQHASSNSFGGISFSADCELIAAYTDIQSEGILIYDRIKAILIRSINIESLVTSVSFNPEDKSRICTSGTTLQFWRYTSKTIHNAPITGLQSASCTYTCHTWLPDRRVVAATDVGTIVVVQQSTVQSSHPAFGSADCHSYQQDGRVTAIFVMGKYVVAASSVNSIAVFEVLKFVVGSGVVNSINSQPALVLKAKFRFAGISEILGLQLSIKSDAASVPRMIVVTSSALNIFEIKVPEISDNYVSFAKSVNGTLNHIFEQDWIEIPGKVINPNSNPNPIPSYLGFE
jgi:WD40 repeat protein